MRLCILILLLCLSAKAQLPVVPLPQFNANTTTNPQTLGARYWWISSDLTTNVNVTNWVDRIQSSVLTNGANSLRPTNSATGVGFNGATWLSNLTTFNYNSGAANTASVFIVFSPVTSAGAIGGLINSDNSSGYGFYTTSGSKLEYFGTSGSPIIGPFVSGNTYDLITTWSNVSANAKFYTNGILAADTAAGYPAISTAQQVFVGKDGEASPAFYKGKILELAWFYSNVPPSVVTSLHTYATNKYGYTP